MGHQIIKWLIGVRKPHLRQNRYWKLFKPPPPRYNAVSQNNVFRNKKIHPYFRADFFLVPWTLRTLRTLRTFDFTDFMTLRTLWTFDFTDFTDFRLCYFLNFKFHFPCRSFNFNFITYLVTGNRFGDWRRNRNFTGQRISFGCANNFIVFFSVNRF